MSDNNFYKKLFDVFAEIEDAKMNSENPYYNSRYADLSSIVKVVKKVCIKYKIFYVQKVHESDTHAIIETTIYDAEGTDNMSFGKCSVPAKKLDPQQYGSALTYARRYSLSIAFNVIADEDDDGNNAMPKQEPTDKEKAAAVGAKLPDDLKDYMRNFYSGFGAIIEMMKEFNFDAGLITAHLRKEMESIDK